MKPTDNPYNRRLSIDIGRACHYFHENYLGNTRHSLALPPPPPLSSSCICRAVHHVSEIRTPFTTLLMQTSPLADSTRPQDRSQLSFSTYLLPAHLHSLFPPFYGYRHTSGPSADPQTPPFRLVRSCVRVWPVHPNISTTGERDLVAPLFVLSHAHSSLSAKNECYRSRPLLRIINPCPTTSPFSHC